ncbi:23S rRNA (guanosine2251-2'-O)-methyltransferase [Constrictibacter sp. MBR-5]|jgi:23S rRNA (guanosine2251-2'-O)-methyltransferase|uniref:23S rRNA (guanosine(2251)-2'-O)-methyltransferase RlmB n=1 Tax=Constrictibacter sp. MBR-5 TaxID=3156467 RepID=UPI00339253B7
MAKRKTEDHTRNKPRAQERGLLWLYGTHAVAAALRNPRRRVRRILALPEAAAEARAAGAAGVTITESDKAGIERHLPRGAVHQGIAAEVEALPALGIEDAVDMAQDRPHTLVVVLDQVTDPQNVGAVLRSATAFGATAVVVPENGSPEAGGALAKAAAGALETMPLIRVVNLKRALETLKAGGFWCLGLAGEATGDIAAHDMRGRTALVLGAEGEGMRRLTRETCDLLVRIPILPEMESLNVSAAAAVSLYEWRRQTGAG